MEDEPGWILEHLKKVEDVLKRGNYHSRRAYSVLGVLRHMPTIPEDDVDPFITACLRRRLYDCVVVAAVRYNRIERLFSTEELNLGPAPQSLLWHTVLNYLCDKTRWSCVMKLCSSISSHVSAVLFMKFLKDCVLNQPLNTEGLEVFHTLLGYSKLTPEMREVKYILERVTDEGLVQQFNILAFHEDENVRRFVSEGAGEQCLVNLVESTCRNRLSGNRHPLPGSDYNACLSVACEAGLLSVSVPPVSKDLTSARAIRMAVRYNQPDIVRFLYRAGAVTNRIVFKLSRHPRLLTLSTANAREDNREDNREDAQNAPPHAPRYPSTDDADAAREIREFLTHKASRPSSLQSLCLREVSKSVGWGHVRDANIDQLEIPKNLKVDLRFQGNRNWLKDIEQKTQS